MRAARKGRGVQRDARLAKKKCSAIQNSVCSPVRFSAELPAALRAHLLIPAAGCLSRRDGSPTHAFISQAGLLRSDPAPWEGAARSSDLGGQARQVFLGKGRRRTWEAPSAQVTHPTPIANSSKSSPFPAPAFPGTPPLTGAGPGSAEHVSAGQPWKVNMQLADLILIRGFFWLKMELTLTST